MALPRDLTGLRFGKLTVVERRPSTVYGGSTWLCKCDCGAERVKSRVALKKTVSCGCAHAESHARRRKPPGEAGLSRLYSDYKTRARRHRPRLKFRLSLDRFRSLTSGPCHYCGDPPTSIAAGTRTTEGNRVHSAYWYNGIDRLDNDEGYVDGNVATCCSNCNYAKGDMSESEFLLMILKIGKHRRDDLKRFHPNEMRQWSRTPNDWQKIHTDRN